jgi:hypothetical protein
MSRIIRVTISLALMLCALGIQAVKGSRGACGEPELCVVG